MTPNGATELLGLFGSDLIRSPSPETHSRWARESHLNWIYLALPCSSEFDFLKLASSLITCPQFRGANVTNPFKTAALKLKNITADESALRCEAANTIYKTVNAGSENWLLANTDLDGCIASIREILRPTDDSSQVDSLNLGIITLGNGAMAKTCAAALKQLYPNPDDFPETHVWDRKLLQELNQGVQKIPRKEALLVINTLPSGTSAEADSASLRALELVNKSAPTAVKFYFDVGYLKSKTQLMARNLQWRTLTGELLFETQARASFKLWSGLAAPTLPTALQRFQE